MPVSPTESMTFTRPLLETFKREYEAAIKRGDYQFSFENHTFLIAYAKYMIEYLEPRL